MKGRRCLRLIRDKNTICKDTKTKLTKLNTTISSKSKELKSELDFKIIKRKSCETASNKKEDADRAKKAKTEIKSLDKAIDELSGKIEQNQTKVDEYLNQITELDEDIALTARLLDKVKAIEDRTIQRSQAK